VINIMKRAVLLYFRDSRDEKGKLTYVQNVFAQSRGWRSMISNKTRSRS
jgi:hypothetical protein